MKVVNICKETIPECNDQEWQMVPVPGYPDCFVLEETRTGKVLGRFMLAEGSNPAFLNLIASAPELQIIAEMYRIAMKDRRAKNDMLFSMITEIFQRIKQPCVVEPALFI